MRAEWYVDRIEKISDRDSLPDHLAQLFCDVDGRESVVIEGGREW
jgi:hypothetical protein